MKRETIAVGDRFVGAQGHVWEVIETYPGGRLTLFDKARTRFMDRYHREVRAWPRAAIAKAEQGGK